MLFHNKVLHVSGLRSGPDHFLAPNFKTQAIRPVYEGAHWTATAVTVYLSSSVVQTWSDGVSRPNP
jgi:hypothetical protein